MKRRWIFWILVIVFLWVVISRFSQIKNLYNSLLQGQWEWVILAILLQILYFTIYSALYQSAFMTVGVKSRLLELIPVTFSAMFMNVAVPIGGASGASLFVDDAARRGESSGRAAIGSLLALLSDFSAFLLVLIVGLIYLITHRELKIYEAITALILLLVIGTFTSFMLLGLWRPQLLRRIMNFVKNFANRLAHLVRRPDALDEAWVEKYTGEFTEAAVAIAANPAMLLRTIATAFAAHTVNLATLFALFMAFHERVTFGVLVAGYSMGILFWIVSITPQGIGVVEGMMTLVFAGLGVPIEKATIIALTFRGLTFWLPMGIGFVLLNRTRSFGVKTTASSEVWSIRAVAILTAAMGVIDVISGLTPTMRSTLLLLEQYSPFGFDNGGHLASVLAGFALIILASGLWRHKRLAWALTVAILVISIPVHLFKGLDYFEALLAALLAGWLIYLRPHFHARSDPPSIRQGLLALLAALVITLIYGVLGFYLLDRHFIVNGQRVSFSVPAALRQTVVMFTQFYNPGLVPAGRFGRYFVNSIYIVSAISIGFALIMLIRPVLVRKKPSQEERQRAKAIVEEYGCSSIARMVLFPDKLYYFSPGGSLVGYVVEGRVALALGDPIGPPEDITRSIDSFCSFCSRNDWQVAFSQVLPDHLRVYNRLGFHALCVGSEAIVDLATFSIAGGDKKNIRTGVNKMNKLGYTAEVLEPPHPQELVDELRQVSDEWLTLMHSYEKRFSLGWFDEEYLNSTRLIVIRNANGDVEAFANILPEYQANEISIDLMRHRPHTEGGLMDYLFVSLIEWAKAQGYASFNMGLSGLAGIGDNPSDPTIDRAMHYIYEHVNQFYNFKGLHEFKAKYDPSWSPRYLVYPSTVSMPAVAIAMLRADSGSDILGALLKPLQ